VLRSIQQVSTGRIRDLAADLATELARLGQLEPEIQRVMTAVERDPGQADLFYESLALKLHNFYTGCERIFRLVATELNGGVPAGQDWHRRLLERMSSQRDGRPAVIQPDTARKLQKYLGFHHVVCIQRSRYPPHELEIPTQV
jgi:hypothetical protein